jgi:hypothetical protein
LLLLLAVFTLGQLALLWPPGLAPLCPHHFGCSINAALTCLLWHGHLWNVGVLQGVRLLLVQEETHEEPTFAAVFSVFEDACQCHLVTVLVLRAIGK